MKSYLKFIQENAFENAVRKLAAILSQPQRINPSSLEQNDHNFADVLNIFSWIKIVFYWNYAEVCSCQIDNKLALVQILAWCLRGTKQLPKPMMTQIIDVYRPQWVKHRSYISFTLPIDWLIDLIDVWVTGSQAWWSKQSGFSEYISFFFQTTV